jgi:hypothetical protein
MINFPGKISPANFPSAFKSFGVQILAGHRTGNGFMISGARPGQVLM